MTRQIVMPSREQILRVLAIARGLSLRGLSLRDLIEEAGYRDLRPRIRAAQLAEILRAKPNIVDDWIAYSEDKRTSFGYGFGPFPAGDWLVDGPEGYRVRFGSRYDGCVAFVLRELDFWLAIEDAA